MYEVFKTETYRGYKIEIAPCEAWENPNDWGDEELFLVYDHRDFTVHRDGFDGQEIFNYFAEKPGQRKLYDNHFVFPVYAYIHSGVALSTNRQRFTGINGCDPGGWDTSFKGFALVKRTKGQWTEDLAYEQVKGLIKTWNQYLSGEVYSYSWEHGGCCGFYGDESIPQMFSEAQSEIDSHIKNKFERHNKYLKGVIRGKVPLIYRKEFIQ